MDDDEDEGKLGFQFSVMLVMETRESNEEEGSKLL